MLGVTAIVSDPRQALRHELSIATSESLYGHEILSFNKGKRRQWFILKEKSCPGGTQTHSIQGQISASKHTDLSVFYPGRSKKIRNTEKWI